MACIREKANWLLVVEKKRENEGISQMIALPDFDR